MTSPSTTDSVAALIARLREATGGNTELDAYIHLAVTPELADSHVREGSGWIIGGNHESPTYAPPYTASIDAALTLLPDKWSWRCNASENRLHSTAIVGRSYPTNANASAEHSSPAIALCIAALEARRQTP